MKKKIKMWAIVRSTGKQGYGAYDIPMIDSDTGEFNSAAIFSTKEHSKYVAPMYPMAEVLPVSVEINVRPIKSKKRT